MKIRLIIYLALSLIGLGSIGAQQMSFDRMEAKSFHVKKNSQNKFKASFKNASGSIQKKIMVGKEGVLLMVTYDISLDVGQAHLSVKSSDESTVVWEKEINEPLKTRNFLINFPAIGEYEISLDLGDAKGKLFFKWELNPSNLKNAHG